MKSWREILKEWGCSTEQIHAFELLYLRAESGYLLGVDGRLNAAFGALHAVTHGETPPGLARRILRKLGLG